MIHIQKHVSQQTRDLGHLLTLQRAQSRAWASLPCGIRGPVRTAAGTGPCASGKCLAALTGLPPSLLPGFSRCPGSMLYWGTAWGCRATPGRIQRNICSMNKWETIESIKVNAQMLSLKLAKSFHGRSASLYARTCAMRVSEAPWWMPSSAPFSKWGNEAKSCKETAPGHAWSEGQSWGWNPEF